ncbi:hypothetical protein [Streptosporangium carneum]|uniref:Uncharacterized protein n=1 Tax=Streptosporangium carneum TaxID=47481 RepID=A0A9W6I3K4_9ACTN|nr:hypothetical protein [Streptosporangium carneum]GLK11401.1 hypothetical protein GCM10017600_48080 [Streptosporangium carneum]
MSLDAVLFGLAYEVIVSLFMLVGAVVITVGLTSALVVALYAPAHRFFRLRRESRLQGPQQEQSPVLELLR